MSADSEPAAPADSSLNAPATAPPAVSDLSSSELTGANWRIECRVFKENTASVEDAARGTYESEFELVLKDPLTLIGRTSRKRNLHPEIACDWDGAVSHRHANIEMDTNGQAFLVDLESTNGTMVNGKLISANTPIELKDGDRISLGSKTALIVHAPER
jgi:pSer/pThr/pTyr-binding forkhead associated (FHA) protein